MCLTNQKAPQCDAMYEEADSLLDAMWDHVTVVLKSE